MKFSTNLVAVPFQVVTLAFLIIATITSPVVPSLSLANDGTYKYGTFGYCPVDATKRSQCSSVSTNYKPSSLYKSSNSDAPSWSMSSTIRDKLSQIMIVAPIAAGLTLIAVVLNFVGILSKNAALASAYWIITIFIAVIAFLASALVCIISFLLFYPHVQWACWLLIPATILNLISLVLIGFASKFLPAAYLRDEDNGDDANNDFGWGSADVSSFDEERKLELGDAPSNNFKVNTGSGFNVVSSPAMAPLSATPGLDSAATGAGIGAGTGVGAGMAKPNYAYPVPGSYPNSAAGDNLSFVPPQPYDTSRTRTMASSVGPSSIADDKNPSASQRDFTYMDENLASSTSVPKLSQTSYYTADDSTKANMAGSDQPGLKLPDVYLDDEEGEQTENSDIPVGNNDNRMDQGEIYNPDGDSGSSQSAFTSVSQRGVNPNYYRGAQQKVNLPEQQYPMSTPYYPSTLSPQPSQSFNGYQQLQTAPMAPMPPMHQYDTSNPYAAPQQPPIQRSRSDMILNNSPDLLLGSNMNKAGVRKYGITQMSQQRFAQSQPHVGNNFKRRQQQQQNFPTPSSLGDGPYGRI
ncbi:hypothetical protein FOA43_001944 [Brettanomyces nanus]|uniref:Uncharacterized protein n=1 Tax=Eeniella nana TaxID=13502 RepID=A0A875S3H0_EENNA|nr:uncharacterized protein FOA43_001944 [Brettanomyces nanus]QPG74612.1 hypothetical protein FOA43_001944 [Brettanomyces nanus]